MCVPPFLSGCHQSTQSFGRLLGIPLLAQDFDGLGADLQIDLPEKRMQGAVLVISWERIGSVEAL
eukprot:CAMPEP_0206494498 /NCGR_PEP_ID=MMETSP0324_2-20121206/47761_1 /ASSEMBLY_ACC=CAM_ASM_000836 /TAXON_ID=2866 /ORGANISM="Crypthecodinium cohnii, Strain Seligo" /LENGTH=64 /DNA_ID=CAMNT_0053978159 /DNA_START=51 /DNA_END=241 /DNA_ORIENTATION=-